MEGEVEVEGEGEWRGGGRMLLQNLLRHSSHCYYDLKRHVSSHAAFINVEPVTVHHIRHDENENHNCFLLPAWNARILSRCLQCQSHATSSSGSEFFLKLERQHFFNRWPRAAVGAILFLDNNHYYYIQRCHNWRHCGHSKILLGVALSIHVCIIDHSRRNTRF